MKVCRYHCYGSKRHGSLPPMLDHFLTSDNHKTNSRDASDKDQKQLKISVDAKIKPVTESGIASAKRPNVRR